MCSKNSNTDGYTIVACPLLRRSIYAIQLLQVEEAITETIIIALYLLSVAAHKQLLYMNQRITLNNVVATPGASLVGRATASTHLVK